ncbi:MAG: UDP-2,3-diacylglucosamine hydrolase [Geobacteraceae bacterium GWC2_48_7]|nr:MAG: UDP-2,3-diacylglucosamine hydrolase [Geobacteraceae bacterium GWC2_48_7]
MRTIFISDAHLENPDDLNYKLLLKFLHELEGNTETLYIMGDLFDFWLGFPQNPFRQYDSIIAALDSLARSGCRLVYFEGNHDFHLGAVFRDIIKTEIHNGPAVMTIQGRRLFLCHGDQVNRADYGYLALRALLHNTLVAASVNIVSPALAQWIRNRLQRKSRAGYRSKTRRWDYREIIRSFAEVVRKQGCDGLICGHFHLPICEELQNSQFTILALGDWLKNFTYGEMIEGKLLLKHYL